MSSIYDYQIDINNPGSLTYLIENLVSGDWYFALAADDSQGLESDHSNEAIRKISQADFITRHSDGATAVISFRLRLFKRLPEFQFTDRTGPSPGQRISPAIRASSTMARTIVAAARVVAPSTGFGFSKAVTLHAVAGTE